MTAEPMRMPDTMPQTEYVRVAAADEVDTIPKGERTSVARMDLTIEPGAMP